jgi:hypothetical protein
MTRLRLRPCLDCGRPTVGARCPAHTIDYCYSSPHWQHVRTARLALDGHLCQFNYPGCTGHATTVHLAPELQGDHSLATLETTRSACHHCHGIEDAPRASGKAATSTTQLEEVARKPEIFEGEARPRPSGVNTGLAMHWGGGVLTDPLRHDAHPASHLAVCTGLGVSG